MEAYLFVALLIIYVVTVATGNKNSVRRIWTLAFICAAFLTAGALFALRVKHQEVMMTADNFNWYFFLYVFGAFAFALGLINLWMYRRALWQMLRASATQENAKE